MWRLYRLLEIVVFIRARKSGKSLGPVDPNFRLLIYDHKQIHRKTKIKKKKKGKSTNVKAL